MKVLIACEESQEVCKAFRALGHEAYSCDIQECSGGHPEWHIYGDALKAIDPPDGWFWTQDGALHTHTLGYSHCSSSLYLPIKCGNTAVFTQMLSPGKGYLPVGTTSKGIRFLYAVYARRCADDMRGKSCWFYELGIPQGRPNHTSILLCRKRKRCGKLPRKAYLPMAERTCTFEAHELTTSTATYVHMPGRKEKGGKNWMV